MVKQCRDVNHDSMRYYKSSHSDFAAGGGHVLTEFIDGIATRQINIAGKTCFISSSLIDWNEKIGFLLYDGNVDELDLSDSVPINSSEFENKWKEALKEKHNKTVLRYLKGDAATPLEQNTLIIHIVNLQGVWGKGFVLSLSKNHPDLKKEYLKWSDDKDTFKPGEVQFIQIDEQANIFVANMLAQEGIKRNSCDKNTYVNYKSLRTCLTKVARFALVNRLSIQMPKIGAGLAGGDWEKIENIINEELVYYKLKCTVCEL